MIKENSEKQIALITGGSRGIGRECVLAFARRDYNIAFTYNSKDVKADGTRREAEKQGIEVIAIKMDISEITQVGEMIAQTLDRFGRIDVLVNNAGISEIKKVEDIDESNWDHVMDTNLKGTFFCTQMVFNHMRKQNNGQIISIASQAGTTGGIFIGAHYSSSKAGIICLTKTFAKIGAPLNIRVNTVSPGLIETDMIEPYPEDLKNNLINSIPLGRTGRPGEVASVVAFLASEDASYITGANIPINGGMLML